jgi:LysM repeat protein
MKRLILIAVGLAGSLFAIPTTAATAAPLPVAVSSVVPASGAPPSAVLVATAAPALPRYTIVSGDTLWALGLKFGRTWENLASYNHVPNPNLIYVGSVLTIPPASYNGPAPAVVSAPVVHTQPAPVQHYVAPVQHYSAPAPVSYEAPGGFQACVMFRESTNGAGSSNLYGILPSTWASLGLAGSPYSASRAQQDAAFNTLYARDGASPWRPYDGC